MNKNLRFFYYMNCGLLLVGIVCLVTGYVIDFKFFRTIFERETIGTIKHFHKWSGYFFTGFLVWHLMNKWQWFKMIQAKLQEK